jgi:integrase
MPLNKFSIARIRTIVAKGKPGIYGDGGGLWLQVTPKGSISWLFRYRSPADGRACAMGLGPLHTVTLAEAREGARRAREARLAGRDPIGERAIRSVNFDVCSAEYLKVRKIATVGWAATLNRYASPVIGATPVAAITTESVLSVLTPIWHDKPFTADRVRRYIEAVLEFATRVKRQRVGENPASWVALKHVLPSPKKIAQVEHLASLPPAELPEFMAALRSRTEIAARALELVILTASRTGDVTGQSAKPGKPAKPPLRWTDVSLDRRVWIIPEDKVGNKNFEVPLSDPVLALLRALPRDNEKVFATLGKNGMWNLLREMRPDLTVHGFRSTFSGWAKNREFNRTVVEVALKHRVAENEIEKAYSEHVTYSAGRARLMQAWADFATGGDEAKVVHLARAS